MMIKTPSPSLGGSGSARRRHGVTPSRLTTVTATPGQPGSTRFLPRQACFPGPGAGSPLLVTHHDASDHDDSSPSESVCCGVPVDLCVCLCVPVRLSPSPCHNLSVCARGCECQQPPAHWHHDVTVCVTG
eukprot:3837846-Rhodomonas_salina.1